MLKVGLTGGIGSGKTIISRIFMVLGIQVYNSDNMAKYLMNNSTVIRNKLITNFGKEVYEKDGTINRKFLANKIFNNKENLFLVNSVVHPEVAKNFNNWLKKHEKEKYIIKEAAILIESGKYKDLDKIILVTASEETRIKRIMQRDNISKVKVLERIKNQLNDNEKMKFADFIIENDGTAIIEQVIKIHEQFIN